jgi:23S rRNA (guanosine2251-2'-O)-methyltransferase
MPKSHKSRRDGTAFRSPAPPADSERGDIAAAEVDHAIYGLIPVLEALRSGHRPLQQITIAEGARHERLKELLELAKAGRVPVHRAPRLVLDRLLPGLTHQGVMARTAASGYYDAEELLERLAAMMNTEQQPLVLGLDAIEDPRNLGAILRTAECAGVDGVFIPERRAVGLTATVAKAAAGALEHVAVARVTNLVQLIERLKQLNIWVVGATGDASANYTEWDWTVPSALFLGNEAAGLHRLVQERCDTLVRFPVRGRIESLNVSVAAGVILYEALRQRSAKK